MLNMESSAMQARRSALSVLATIRDALAQRADEGDPAASDVLVALDAGAVDIGGDPTQPDYGSTGALGPAVDPPPLDGP